LIYSLLLALLPSSRRTVIGSLNYEGEKQQHSKMASDQGNVGLTHEQFTLTLDRVIDGDPPSYLPLTCKFQYFWDFPKNEGLAHLMTMNDGKVNQIMLPLGIKDQLDFKTPKDFTAILGDDTRVEVIAVILDLKGHALRSAAAIVGTAANNTTLATCDWDEKELKPALDFNVVDEKPIH
jgi:hypothetical protein